MKLYIASDNSVWALNVQDPVSLAPFPSATITGTVSTLDGTVLGTIGGFVYQPGSVTVNTLTYSGANFKGTFTAAEAAGIVRGTAYRVSAVITVGSFTRTLTGIAMGYSGPEPRCD